ncbi:deoxyhypusine synthase family protein [Synechococcus sp. PCC 7336]|uniref:deoxyhypusine synthase family protein n=1 Tax=Synechococcus sp. PCC 7336 TaxID=195250 RepID=UPI000345E5BE|nr:deoxyhypusine synthase family protein [Synechococcus sp. PCC 7336]
MIPLSIDERQLRECDLTIAEIAKYLSPKPYSSQEFIHHMGEYLTQHAKDTRSVVLAAYQHQVPIFVPAFSDCSAGFGLVHHQWKSPECHLTIDSVRDFRQLTQCKLASTYTGLVTIGGGVPKNFAQDTVVAAELLGFETSMHKYSIQITVADERDGGLSGSTLREAHSWGKVDKKVEQMVFAEATLAFPLVAGYVYGKNNWQERKARCLARLFCSSQVPLAYT